MKRALVLGGGGFIGGHMVRYLKDKSYWVTSVDIQYDEYSDVSDYFIIANLTNQDVVKEIIHFHGEPYDEIYQFAADMGGAGYIFTGENDANVMYNSSIINLNVLNELVKFNADKTKKSKIFYSSSACIYPEHNQLDPDNPNCEESSAYPANPDSEYGWEKLFSERLYLSFSRNHSVPVRIARYHNIFGPHGAWKGGREKSPAAICRKVAEANDGGSIEIWGDGTQTRSFLYVDECVEATYRLMQSDFSGPVNIGSEEMVTINDLVDIVCEVAGKKLTKIHVDGPLGVRGRNSHNDLIRKELQWNYSMTLKDGISKTYEWINTQVHKDKKRVDRL